MVYLGLHLRLGIMELNISLYVNLCISISKDFISFEVFTFINISNSV